MADMHAFNARDDHWMTLAIGQARQAMADGEVPVGAVLVSPGGDLLAAAGNNPIGGCDPTAHAEIRVLRQGAGILGNYRLSGCTLYVTLEPCPMCLSAIATARVARVVYGASDDRLGACGGALNLSSHRGLNPHTVCQGGLMQAESAALLRSFFESKRPAREERLQRISRLEDVPNIDTVLRAYLQSHGISSPPDLALLLRDDLCAKFTLELEPHAETLARVKALRHFVAGGAALPWRSFLDTDGSIPEAGPQERQTP